MFNVRFMLGINLVLFFLSSCDGSEFKGSSGSDDTDKDSKSQEAKELNPKQVTNYEPTDIDAGDSAGDGTVQGDGTTIGKECTATPDYNPEQISCSLPYNHSIWQNESWRGAVANFAGAGADLSSNWISAQPGCTELPQEKLVYVSHFRLSQASRVNINLLNDNRGRIRLWRSANKNQEVLNSETNNLSNNPFSPQLQAGFYTVVIESMDRGSHSAILGSFQANGTTVQRTHNANNDWCIFRVSAATNVPDYVTQNGACRPCMTGR